MNLEFYPDSHTYKLNGILVPGVTTITGILPKPWMGPWVAKETCEFIRLNYQEEKYADIGVLLKDAKAAYKEKAGEAADRGKAAHSFFEAYVKAEMAGKNKDALAMPTDLQARNSITSFLAWAMKYQIEWLASELVVGSEELMYAGTLDAIARINGVVTLIDFKTSRDIYSESYIQLAGYQLALGRFRPDIIIQQRAIAWFPKEGNEWEFRIVPTPYALDAEAFKQALGIYRWIKHTLPKHELKEAA